MLNELKRVLATCPADGALYLVHKLSMDSGFFMCQKRLVYVVSNKDDVSHQSLATEFLRLNTNVEIQAVENDQQFKSGKYNTIEILPVDGDYKDSYLDSFAKLCDAHTRFMGASDFVKFFYSLVNLFQYPREQQFVNLIGFFGELSFLQYISENLGTDLSGKWHASGSSDKYDISLKTCNFEIKTVLSSDGLVSIKHNQIFNLDKNYLVAVIIEENNSGKSLNTLLADLQRDDKYFKSFNFALNVEKEKMRISPVDAETKKFTVKQISIYEAKEINPFHEVPGNVFKLSYKLDLTVGNKVKLETLKKEISYV